MALDVIHVQILFGFCFPSPPGFSSSHCSVFSCPYYPLALDFVRIGIRLPLLLIVRPVMMRDLEPCPIALAALSVEENDGRRLRPNRLRALPSLSQTTADNAGPTRRNVFVLVCEGVLPASS